MGDQSRKCAYSKSSSDNREGENASTFRVKEIREGEKMSIFSSRDDRCPLPSYVQAQWMDRAFENAEKAKFAGDVPVGALVVEYDKGARVNPRVIGEGFNTREKEKDPVGHAEVNAIRQAAQSRGSWRLDGCGLYVTLEPCVMCAGAILAARLDFVVFAAWDKEAGAAGSLRDVLRDSRLNHQVEVYGGVEQARGEELLRQFFMKKRS